MLVNTMFKFGVRAIAWNWVSQMPSKLPISTIHVKKILLIFITSLNEWHCDGAYSSGNLFLWHYHIGNTNAHRFANLKSHNYNLPIFIGFLNQQISDPHNQSIKKIKATLQGIKSDVCHVDKIIYAGCKQDVLALVKPLSKVSQDNELILPSLITCCAKTLKLVDLLLTSEGSDALRRKEVFPNTVTLINQFSPEATNIVLERQTRNDMQVNPGQNYSLFYEGSYLVVGEIKEPFKKSLMKYIRL